MPDFDANEDLTRVPGSGQGGQPDPAERSEISQRPPIIPRVRQPRDGHGFGRLGWSNMQPGSARMARRRRVARSACPTARRASLAEAPSRRRLRLWAMCHGRPPGFQS
jgi:hypothetical protein